MRRPSSLLVLLALLAGCVGRSATLAPALASSRAVIVPAPVAPTPINAGLSTAAALWHLRAGLNVAALACRGPEEAALIAGYNALLASHAAALAKAEAEYHSQYQAGGSDWRDRYDDDQTRLYNFWGQARGRAALCRAAGETLTALKATDDAALATAAPARLAALDQTLAPPRVEVDARIFAGPTMVKVASR